jgi:phosphate transport system ATP-binding protein
MFQLRSRYTIAIVTHNLHQVKRVADRKAFMYVDTSERGRTGYLVEFGETAQIFHDPKERHTQEYVRGEFS